MAKAKETAFFCSECGYESPKWSGQCPSCKAWNTMVEAPTLSGVKATVRKPSGLPLSGEQPRTLREITAQESERLATGIGEFDRVLGGGIVKGSLILVGGDPGIGKSTILTQVCRQLSSMDTDVLYVSGEESLQQIRMRADRIGQFTDHFKLFCETDLDTIEKVISNTCPQVCVIDSIQTMYRPDISGAPGSMAQVRECTGFLLQIAKGMGISIFVVGHVTKEGVVAGPRMLEHMVDTVLYFEGEAQSPYRVLRGVKNRFGSTNEIGVFEMAEEGLREVKNPSEYLLLGRPKNTSGSIVSCTIEGTRQILVEIQALVTQTVFGNPRRSAAGIDYNRLNLLTAVLEKRLGLNLAQNDVYVNVVGGIRINETALDLAFVIAIASGLLDFTVPSDMIAIGEVGLSGEVRNVSQVQARINEAAKMGFESCIVPAASLKNIKCPSGMNVIGVENVSEAVERARMRGR